jgi:LAO/AO transport system kinase
MVIDYANEILSGSVLAVARLITLLENNDDQAYLHLEKLYFHTGKAYIIGITGPPGTGKSTLIESLTGLIRKSGLTVGIIAVDPSNIYTGGAVLGDRIRMSNLNRDSGVFIRSMANRGCIGGLARSTKAVIKVLDAFGKDIIIVETVGIGQDEIEISRTADTTCVVLVPGMGDDIQFIKSGIMEIANIFIINKTDLAGSEEVCKGISYLLQQKNQITPMEWLPPVLKTTATQEIGIDKCLESIEKHRNYLERSGNLIKNRQESLKNEVLQIIHDKLYHFVFQRLAESGKLTNLVQDVLNYKRNPYSISTEIITNLYRDSG